MSAHKKKRIPVSVAAKELGVSTKHIYALLDAGAFADVIDISVSGNGGSSSLRISWSALEEFKKKRQVKQGNVSER